METLFLILATLVALAVPYVLIAAFSFVYGRGGTLLVGPDHDRSVTVFIPTCNEEKNIARKLDNLLGQDYKIAEILILDCSTDRTPDIVAGYQKAHPGTIRLISQGSRIGNARTFNQALKEARGDIIVKTDCDSLAKSSDALRRLVSNFGDPAVGGATGVCVSSRGLEAYFRSFMTRIQRAESNLDSTLIAHSTSLLAFRKSATVPVNPDSMAEDTEEFVLMRKKGIKTILDPTVVSEEEVPEDPSDRRSQKTRRAAGVLGAVRRNWRMVFNPKYGSYGMIVLPTELFVLVASPILGAAILILLGYALFLVSPLLLLACVLGVGAAVFVKRAMVLAIVEVQIVGLVAAFQTLFGSTKAPVWKRFR